MTEEQKIFAGYMFDPRKQELRDIKHRTHEACRRYNAMDEYDPERLPIVREFIGALGKTYYCQGPIQVNYGSPRVSDLRGMAKALVNTCTMATLLSVVLLFFGVQLPDILFRTVDLVGSATTPVSMLVVGMQLGNSNFRSVLGNKRLVIMSLVKMITVPALTFFLVNWLPIAASLKIALVFGATFPVSVSVVTISSMEGKNSVLAAEGVALTTLMAMITLPVMALLLNTYYF